MNKQVILGRKELFPGSDVVRKYTYKAAMGWGTCALLATMYRNETNAIATTQERCALFYKNRCFECLSPHLTRA